MSNRKVIVASNIPSIKEVLADSNHFLLFNNSSSDEFLSKISLALHLDEESKLSITEDNFEKLGRNYSEENLVKYLNLIR